MLPNIVIVARFLVLPVALESGIWHVLLVQTPADAGILKKVNNGSDAGPKPVKTIVGYSPCTATRRGDIVGLPERK